MGATLSRGRLPLLLLASMRPEVDASCPVMVLQIRCSRVLLAVKGLVKALVWLSMTIQASSIVSLLLRWPAPCEFPVVLVARTTQRPVTMLWYYNTSFVWGNGNKAAGPPQRAMQMVQLKAVP